LLGPRIGYSGNFGKISAPFFAVDFAYCPPFLDRNLSFGFELGFYWSNTKETSAEDEEEVKTSVWVLPLLARIVYQIPVAPFAFYFGIGGGLAVSDTQTESESASRTADRRAHGGLSGIGGADLALGPGRVVIEVEYLYTFTRKVDIEGNLGGLLVTAGYRFEFLL
jgi:hypothetical protein